ncbi:outer membrane receptor protein involved in Fe transport [Mucilaginibacter oryzae]|uniref:Outer membrane receptor protein involved in Fe transport n=1 Tax=Mucilaginibacter oryzae TaxID=468058 RepID=A0A316HKX7_9SPHI|nr:TonB-dependent receptor [Mucilaginibacter oryzae]PWK80621.1 outer membrane receptor protein involved in Fe transport [Mucilaginibacter oryzae]
MKKLSLLLITTLVFCAGAVQAQQTQKKLKKILVNHFFSCPLDELLDTLALNYQVRIVFERTPLHEMDVVEHFFEEPLKDVIAKVCNENSLHYWIESTGTIYILQNTDDLARLQKLNKLALQAANTGLKAKEIEAPKAKPKHFLINVNGRVIDQQTGESLPSASVKIRGTDLSTMTNSDGYFTLFRVPSDTSVVEVSYTGFQTDYFRLSSDKLNSPLICGLFPSLNSLNEVTITGKKSGVMNTDSRQVGVLQLSPANLDKLPTMGDKDILRAFQLMPGVAGTNESSSGAYVRGGTPDQNLVVLDGFTIYQVDHLYGFFSAFNASAVKDVQMYKGGFTSKYGGRLSSVTEINGKEGNKNETNIGTDLSLLSASGYLETPLSDKSTLLLAVRRSYQGPFYNKIFNQFNQTSTTQGGGGGRPGGGFGGGGFANQITPSSYFYDFDAKYTYTISQKDKVSWSLYTGTDKTDNSRDLGLPSFLSSGSSGISITDYTKYGNLGSSIKWFRQWNKKLYSNNYITYSSYFNDRNRSSSGFSQIDTNGISHTLSNGTLETNNLKDVGYKSEWEWTASNKYKLLFGGFASYKKIDYEYTQNDTSKLINQHNSAMLAGFYTELAIDPNNKFHIQPGLRASYFGPTTKPYFEPRLSASYNLSDQITLKGATGQFYQFENQVIRQDVLGGNRNFWVLSNNANIPVSQARHFILGASYENDGFLFSLEGYYKTLNGLTQYTVQQTRPAGAGGGGFMNFNQNQTIEEKFYEGTGRTRGIELLVQKKMGRYTGWISYTLGKAQNKFSAYGDNYYDADQDVRHEFKSINMYHYQRWNFAATFLFSTGHPYTAPLSTYTVKTVDGNAITYINLSDKNAERLPAYHRLDLSASYDLLKIDGRKVGSIGFSLFNVYNHVNSWYREYQLQNNQVITTNVNYLGFTPNLTLSLKWK